MIAQDLLGLKYRRLMGLVCSPVNLAFLQIVQIYLAHWRLLILQRVVGVLAPVVCRGDDDAARKGLLTRRGKKAIDVGLLNFVVVRKEFALDGVVLAGALRPRHQVNAGVAGIHSLL